MNNFLMLVQNENMKIYRRLRTWIMFGTLILFVLLFGSLLSLGGADSLIGAWDVVGQLFFLYYLVTIYSVIAAADIVAGEFTWGTIKLLLIRPWTRTKVLGSKLVAVLLFTLAMTAVFLITVFAVSFIMYPNTAFTLIPQGHSPLGLLMETLLYGFVDLLVITLFSFMLSAVFRSSGIAIGLSIFILFTRNIFTLLFNPVRFPWAKYVLFTNMNLGQYRGGQVGPAGMTMTFSSVVLAVYMVLFLVIAWIVFKERDVAA